MKFNQLYLKIEIGILHTHEETSVEIYSEQKLNLTVQLTRFYLEKKKVRQTAYFFQGKNINELHFKTSLCVLFHSEN